MARGASRLLVSANMIGFIFTLVPVVWGSAAVADKITTVVRQHL